MVNPNDAPLMRKTGPLPMTAMSRPATAGPVTRPSWKLALLSAMALDRCSRSTISGTKACRPGLSSTVIMPSPKANRYTCQTWAAPAVARIPRPIASTPMAAWVQTSSLRLSIRSTSAPPHSPKKSMGRNWRAVVMPSAMPLPPLSWRTSQSCAMRCIHVPGLDSSWPRAYSR